MLFKKQTGHSPLTYFNLLKMQQACLLLDTTDMKINQICYKIGIEDTYYFSRLFSKIMGMSPREYRKIEKRLTKKSVVTSNSPPSGRRGIVGSSDFLVSLYNHSYFFSIVRTNWRK